MLMPFLIESGSPEREIATLEKLAKSVGIELCVIETLGNAENYLEMDEGALSFHLARPEGGPDGPVLALDFIAEYESFMKQVSKTAAGPLKGAIGRELKRGDWVVDGTCGTGKDSLLFLSWGVKVLAFERHPLMFLLQQRSRQALIQKYPELEGHFELIFGDVRSWAKTICERKISVLYFDPMFEEGPKTRCSLPRQEMVVFEQLVGPDLDQNAVIEGLLKLPLKRLVVKRPRGAPDLGGLRPVASFPGKSVRYDLFRGCSSALITKL